MLRENNMTKQLFEITLTTEKKIEECIYNIRGQQVMLDSDIASFFKVETKALNRQMKRNISRFPGDFCFQLNSNEFKNLRCQNGTFNSITEHLDKNNFNQQDFIYKLYKKNLYLLHKWQRTNIIP